jgi:hypothetical protein
LKEVSFNMIKYSPKAIQNGNNVEISGVEHFGLKETFDCGQAFRWQEFDENSWIGIAHGRAAGIGGHRVNGLAGCQKQYSENQNPCNIPLHWNFPLHLAHYFGLHD